MSASKTQNYQLHAWAPGDDFLREEFNENFAGLDQALKALDGKKTEVVTGKYTGANNNTSGSQTITLGFTPRAVLLSDNGGTFSSTAGTYGGLAVTEEDGHCVKLIPGGFIAEGRAAYIGAHHYVAFR